MNADLYTLTNVFVARNMQLSSPNHRVRYSLHGWNKWTEWELHVEVDGVRRCQESNTTGLYIQFQIVAINLLMTWKTKKVNCGLSCTSFLMSVLTYILFAFQFSYFCYCYFEGPLFFWANLGCSLFFPLLSLWN